MDPYLVIGSFIVILAVVLYWFQGRQAAEKDDGIVRTPPNKEITVVKKSDWVADEKPEVESEPKPEPKPEPAPEPEPTPEPSVEEEAPVDDISELSGVGPKYQQLLRAAGIASIALIAESDPEELLKRLIEVNEAEEITKRPPTMYNVNSWIESAKSR